MKKIIMIVACMAVTLRGAHASTIQMTGTTGTYSQDFNTLIGSGSATWADDSTLAGWYAKQQNGTLTTIAASTGSSTGGALYSFGSLGNSDRALGSVGSGTPGDFAWGVQLSNKTGNIITNLSLSYFGEQWRNSAAAAQTVTFWYKVGSEQITDLTPGADAEWTAVTALDFTSPITGGSAGLLDGNAVANRTSLSANIAVTLQKDEYIMFRWRDVDHSGNDHGLATDDFSATWQAIPEPATFSMVVFSGLFLMIVRRMSRV